MRCDVECAWESSLDNGLEKAAVLQPDFIVLQAPLFQHAQAWLRRLRLNGATSRIPVAVVAPRPQEDRRGESLSLSGANAIIPEDASPFDWDLILGSFLDVVPRRAVRIEVHFAVWGSHAEKDEELLGLCLNLSMKGLLIETAEPLAVGAQYAMRFDLPVDFGEVRGVFQVMRTFPHDSKSRSGAEFLVLHGRSRGLLTSFIRSSVSGR